MKETGWVNKPVVQTEKGDRFIFSEARCSLPSEIAQFKDVYGVKIYAGREGC